MLVGLPSSANTVLSMSHVRLGSLDNTTLPKIMPLCRDLLSLLLQALSLHLESFFVIELYLPHWHIHALVHGV